MKVDNLIHLLIISSFKIEIAKALVAVFEVG
jgi:hypothetical protein